MKRMSKIMTLALALCMLLSLSVFASGEPSGEAPAGVVPGTYADGDNILVIADDMTFTMETAGANIEGAAFVLTVAGTVTADGVFTITSLKDGDIELIEMATEEQKAENLATVEATYAAAAGTAPKGVVPGTYTDGTLTLIIADDMTFTMDKAAENMDGAAFTLTVAGTVTADGVFAITSLKEGDIELIELATEDQKAADLASVEAVYAAATAASASGEATAELDASIHVPGVNVMNAFTIDVDLTFADQGNGVKTFLIEFDANSISGTINMGVWTVNTGDANEQSIADCVKAAYEAMTGAGGA